MSQPDDDAQLEWFRLYELLWAKLNQEGDGIWARFNILVGLNAGLLAAFTFFFASESRHPLWREFTVGISVLGVLLSSWSLLVLNGLWAWHRHWKSQLAMLEARFPRDWPTPHKTRPSGLPLWRGAPGSTQPIFFVLVIAWAVLLGVGATHGR